MIQYNCKFSFNPKVAVDARVLEELVRDLHDNSDCHNVTGSFKYTKTNRVRDIAFGFDVILEEPYDTLLAASEQGYVITIALNRAVKSIADVITDHVGVAVDNLKLDLSLTPDPDLDDLG